MTDQFLRTEMINELQKSADSLLSVIGTWRFLHHRCNSHLIEALELVNAQLEELRAIE